MDEVDQKTDGEQCQQDRGQHRERRDEDPFISPTDGAEHDEAVGKYAQQNPEHALIPPVTHEVPEDS